MADKTIKCSNYSKCKQKWNFTPIKGPNNTELCSKCGGNICFICGKKWEVEENFRWVEDYDCRGNKIMTKAYYDMFSQKEKDENHPEGDLTVYYCDEHRAEREKSPNKWTKADREQLEKKKEQEKQEREEKLNNSKGLFYCHDPFSRAVEIEGKKIEGIDYGCIYFQGQENGRNFYLLVPDTHPDLADFRYKKKSKRLGGQEVTRWTLKTQFYLVEGVDNLPLEATSPSSHNSQFNAPDSFAKVVGLNDKITITPDDSQGGPVKNKSTDNPTKSQEEIKQLLIQYFQKKKIKRVLLKQGDLIVEYENGHASAHHSIENIDISKGFPELNEAKNYLEKISKNEITLSELINTDTNSNSTEKPQDKKFLVWCGIGGVILVIVVVGLGVWLRGRKRKKIIDKKY